MLCMRVAVLLCRDAEVLSMFAAIINKLKQLVEGEVPKVFEAVFEVTLQVGTGHTSCTTADQGHRCFSNTRFGLNTAQSHVTVAFSC